MKKLRYYVAVWLFDLAARVYPFSGTTSQAHHVGDKWLKWEISNG